ENTEKEKGSVLSVNSVADLRQNVLGMVAYFLTVRREYAALIDLALGEKAQRFLVRDRERLVESLAALEQSFSGRVSFLPLEARTSPAVASSNHYDMASHPGFVARAEQVVTCEQPEMADLP